MSTSLSGGIYIMKKIVYMLSLVAVSLLAAVPLAWSGISTEGLMLYFDFDSETEGAVEDKSGGSHNGTLNAGAEIIANERKYGTGAIKIEGGQQAMIVESFAKLEEYQENTLLFWINFTAPATGAWDEIINKPAPGSDRSPGLWVTPEGLSIHYRYNPGNLGPWGITQTGNQDGNFFEENVWYHVAGVTEGGQVVAYVNGVEVAKVAVPAAFAQGKGSGATGGLYVGNTPAYGGVAAKFILDELVFYERVLEPNEIKAIMEGDLTPVKAKDKLACTWGVIKNSKLSQ
jgi:hypothetical protein